MADITLTSSVRQNLLSLQSTAELLSRTQGRLATGNKVNSALDNPTNFFTAASLEARSSDINNLLDGISNGVQIIQAANTGITSLQKLVDTRRSRSPTRRCRPRLVTRSRRSLQLPSLVLPPTTLLARRTRKLAVTGVTAAGMTADTVALSALTSAVSAGDTLTVNGKTITFAAGTGTTSASITTQLATSPSTLRTMTVRPRPPASQTSWV